MTSIRRALVILHEPDNSPALVGEYLEARGVELVHHVVNADYETPNDPAPFPDDSDFDLLVLMGSIYSVADKERISNWIHDEVAMVQRWHEQDKPILGICFGGQLIADALGGEVEVAPVTEIGWFEIDGEDNPLGPGPWKEWHHDRFAAPPQAEVLATTENAVQLIRVGRTVGTQFHPEVTEAHVKLWLENAPDEYLSAYGVDRDDLIAAAAANEPNNRCQTKHLVDWFLDDIATAP